MQEEAGKKNDFEDPYHQRIAHEIGSAVEHGTVIIRVKHAKVIENTGVQSNMHDQESNQKKTCQRHHYFSTDCRSEELRPFHKICGVEKFDAKLGADSHKSE
jgi:hypothetical protein